MEKLQELLKQKWFQLTATLLIGVTVGAVFYPNTKTEERVRTKIQEEYSLKEKEIDEKHQKELSKLTQELSESEKSHKDYEKTSSSKIHTLTTENTQLKQSSKKTKYKLVKPDGTIVEREVEESSSDSTKNVVTEVQKEFNEKVKSIEDKWKTIHEQRVAVIQKEFDEKLQKTKEEQKSTTITVDKQKTTESNPKKLRPEIGVTTSKNIYLHGTYSLWGPVFLGGGVSGTSHSFGEGRLGVGVEF